MQLITYFPGRFSRVDADMNFIQTWRRLIASSRGRVGGNKEFLGGDGNFSPGSGATREAAGGILRVADVYLLKEANRVSFYQLD